MIVLWNRRRNPYRKFACYEQDQIEVNKDADFESYAASCYHAEQYAKKVVKNKLWLFHNDFFLTHNLVSLVGDLALCYGISENDPVMKDLMNRCYNLDDLYQNSRYPSLSESKEKVFSRKIAEKAVADAEAIVQWVRGLRNPVVPSVE